MPTIPTTPTGREPVRTRKAAAPTGPSLFDSFGSSDGATVSTSGSAAAARGTTGSTYRCARTRSDLAELITELKAAEWIAVDTETTGLSPILADLCGLSFSTKEGTGWYVPVRSPEPGSHLDVATVLGR